MCATASARYLAIYLLAVHKRDPASIGVVMTLAGIAALLTQGPAGALIDRTRSKRAVVALAAILVTASCLVLPFVSSFSLVALTQAASAVAASVFARRFPRFPWGSPARGHLPAAPGAMKPSITPATPWPRCSPVGWPTCSDRWWCST